MKNLIDCNLETIGALVLTCREKGYNLKEMFEKLYPEALKDFDPQQWANEWASKTITGDKDIYKEATKNGETNVIFIASLGDNAYATLLFDKVNEAIGKLEK